MATNPLIDIRNGRLAKASSLRALGLNPYPARGGRTHYTKTILDDFASLEGKTATVAGRLMSWRKQGALAFAHIQDQTGRLQLFFRRNLVQPTDKNAGSLGYAETNLLDLGDIIEATGKVVRTERGEISVLVEQLRLLTKALRPLPDQWAGLKDREQVLRKRYLDTTLERASFERFGAACKMVAAIRAFLHERGFLEFQTPILQPQYGGGTAKPFKTHVNALGCGMYLAISHELYLKRLIVAGYDKVFTIGRYFRNEGIDRSHHPEFSMVETMTAYENYQYNMDLIEEMFRRVAVGAFGKTTFDVRGHSIDFGKPWRRVSMADAVLEKTGVDFRAVQTVGEANERLAGLGVAEAQASVGEALVKAFEATVEKELIQPTLVFGHPVEISPLAKPMAEDPRFVERFEIFIAGMECGDNWSEQNDPAQLLETWRRSYRAEDRDAGKFHTLDFDFIEALEYGMPPTTGIGPGIERMMMIFTGQENIDDVIFFPLMRPSVSPLNASIYGLEEPSLAPVEDLALSDQTNITAIRDNHFCGRVGDFLKPHLKAGANLSVVSAYFTIYAYAALKDELDAIAHMQFLFGDPTFVKSLDPDKTATKAFLIDAAGLKLATTLHQKKTARDCADWIRHKVDVKSVKQTNFLHAKLYHIRNGETDAAILGSSNFTPRGLGLHATGSNIELNLAVENSAHRNDLKAWFDKLWNDPDLVTDVKNDVLLYLAQIYQNHPPEFIYYKTLYHIFQKFLGDARKTDEDLGATTLFDTEIWKTLFDFQKDGVKGAINKILAHNGCILADSVGLGKTYEALAVIKYFELRNECVLVLAPKKLRENWTVYRLNDALNPFGPDQFRYDVLNHTDLSRERGYSGNINLETLNWGNYDLVVIDESHNFRNNTPGRRDDEGRIIRRSRYQRLMEDIIASGVKTKVLLLSATPVNNDLKDLRNQVYFVTAGADDSFKQSFGIQSIKETLRQAQAHFSNWAKQPPNKRKTADLLGRLGSDFFKLLDELTIARARKHVQKYYAHEMERLGGFPKRRKPISLYPDIDLRGRFLSYDKLNDEIDGYKLSLFNPSKYVKPEFRPQYQTPERDPFTQADRETFLIGMMKVNFLKRLESSVEAFEITMDNTIVKIDALERKIRAFKDRQKGGEEFALDELELAHEEDEDSQEALEVGGKFKYKLEHLRLDDWLRDLKKDQDQLHLLHLNAKDVTPERDAKLAELKNRIAEKVRRPEKNRNGEPNRKVLVFTAFADTAEYLYENLHKWAREDLGIHSALVTGSGTNRTTYQPAGFEQHTEFNHILTNFSPRSKRRAKNPKMSQEGEIDLLIATDCISEGQNLQDCDFLVNYDIHWNPVRIIQRFGRIDRIGSLNSFVQLVNLWPTQNLDNYISLKRRVEARMALVDIAATLEDNPLKSEELEELIKDDLRYRDRQLLRLKDEVLDIDDLDDSVSLTEFTLDDFRIDLLKYLEANRSILDAAPFGLYTVVPPPDKIKAVGPGVVWCFHQKTPRGHDPGRAVAQVNPLQPYFLVYVLDDGNIRFGFAHPKQILGIYRELCGGKANPYEELCNLFDQQTKDGQCMALYDNLLQKAIDSIAKTFQKRLVSGLQSSRDFIIPKQNEQARETTDFELVTWLVIQQPK